MANSNRRVNTISRLVVEEDVVEDPAIITKKIVNFYSSFYHAPFS